MKKEKIILNRIEKAFLNTMEAFLVAPFSFYLEEDIRAYMYHELANINYLSKETFPITVDEFERDDVLLHTQTDKSKRKDKKDQKKQNGYFDITIYDDETMTKDDPNYFVAIELKYGTKNCSDKSVIEDMSHLLENKNRIKYGFMFCFSDCEKKSSAGETTKKNLINKLRLLLKDKKSNTCLFYYFINSNYDDPKDQGVLLFRIDKGITTEIITELDVNWSKLGFTKHLKT